MSDRNDIEWFESHLETLGFASTVGKEPPATTVTLDSGRIDGDSASRLHTLPEFSLKGGREDDDVIDLDVMKTLGEGGMGVVQLANQMSLDREVAVKTVRDETDESVAYSLLQEAYVTGFLEHPNIIPVHTVGRTADGAPLIVMKRVEGDSWLEAIGEEGSLELERDLEILIEVTNAVRFAHSRGVIHRDIKPENVMVGDFDEVYLLDWGIAVSLRTDRPLLPSRGDADGVSGTPMYMAPEMAGQEDESIDERTDVYLLGATLHHLLTGQPRHTGESVLQVLFSAYQSDPVEYAGDVPEELADIANRACHRDRQQRFQSAQAFQNALKNFLRRRESVEVSASADIKRKQLETLLDDETPDPVEVHDTYGECRFGFEQALRMWSDNDVARRGLQKTLEAMAAYHIRRENVDAARGCIAELPEDNPQLVHELEELVARVDADRRELHRLQAMEDQFDLSTASFSRSVMLLLLGVLWTATSLYAAVTQQVQSPTETEELRHHMSAGFRNLGIGVVAMWFFRRRIFANEINRRLIYMLGALLVAMAFVRWSFWYLEESVFVARLTETVMTAMAVVAIGLISDLKVAFFALIFAAVGAISMLWPEWQLYANTAGVGLIFVAFAWVWNPSKFAASQH